MKSRAANSTEGDRAIAWPADRFFWAVVEAPGVQRAGPVAPGLAELLEDEIPASLDDLFAVQAPCGDSRLLVCALPKATLQSLERGLDRLMPTEVPAEIAIGVAPESLNLLQGAFEPPHIRRRRQRWRTACTACLLAMLVFTAFGLSRRAEHWRERAFTAERERAALIAATIPGQLPSDASMAAERARWEDRARSTGLVDRPRAGTPALAMLLGSWPLELDAELQSVLAKPDEITVSALVRDDPADFLAAFSVPEPWRLTEPQIRAVGNASRLTLRLTRPAPGGTP